MWKTKVWKFKDETSMEVAKTKMTTWLERNKGRIQYEEIFINNAYGIQYRRLMWVY